MTKPEDIKSQEDLLTLEKSILQELERVSAPEEIEGFRIKYLGKKGILRGVLKNIKNIPSEKRKDFGAEANRVRTKVQDEYEKVRAGSSREDEETKGFDPTLPAWPFEKGGVHPLVQIRNRITEIFSGLGFSVSEGPEVETPYYNFDALNFPPHHPARDMQDTFFVEYDRLLRTHTSPVQIRVMEEKSPPIKTIMPGRVYRNEEISARSYCLFHQVEGLYIDRGVSLADLKGTLLHFAKSFFDDETEIKIRPSFFPFTEPSIEVDIRCFLCKGEGCSVCKKTGWLEVLGAGMVHPNVLKSGGIDHEEFSGYAFGMGIDRIGLLKYGIKDIRLFFENDMRFLGQF